MSKSQPMQLDNKDELIYLKNAMGRTLLHVAVLTDDESAIKTLLHVMGISRIKHLDNKGMSALNYAAANGGENIVRIMLQFEPNLLDSTDKFGFTPFKTALLKGQKNVVDTILSIKPEIINDIDSNGCSPLHLAVTSKNAELVNYILQKEQKLINIFNDNEHTALDLAIEIGNVKIIELLISASDSVNREMIGDKLKDVNLESDSRTVDKNINQTEFSSIKPVQNNENPSKEAFETKEEHIEDSESSWFDVGAVIASTNNEEVSIRLTGDVADETPTTSCSKI